MLLLTRAVYASILSVLFAQQFITLSDIPYFCPIFHRPVCIATMAMLPTSSCVGCNFISFFLCTFDISGVVYIIWQIELSVSGCSPNIGWCDGYYVRTGIGQRMIHELNTLEVISKVCMARSGLSEISSNERLDLLYPLMLFNVIVHELDSKGHFMYTVYPLTQANHTFYKIKHT